MKNPIIKCSVRSVKSSRWCQGQTNHKDKCPRNTCERSLTSPVIKEVQIKVGYHFPLIGLAKMNNKNNTITFRPKGAHRHQWGCVCVVCVYMCLRACSYLSLYKKWMNLFWGFCQGQSNEKSRLPNTPLKAVNCLGRPLGAVASLHLSTDTLLQLLRLYVNIQNGSGRRAYALRKCNR